MDIIELAKEAGFETKSFNSIDQDEVVAGINHYVITDVLERFAALVRAGVLADQFRGVTKMVGCAYCNNPLFAGTKCNNCGRVTLAEPMKQEPVASVRWGKYKSIEWTATEQLHELLGRYREGQTPLQLYAAPIEPVKQEPVAWQFFEDGLWHNGSDYNCHRQNTEEAGYQIRELYAAPVDAKAIRAEALEEAAQMCERKAPRTVCAAAIRGLK